MKRNKLVLCMLSLCVAGVASATTVFNGGDLRTAANWSNGIPGNSDAVGTINVDGSYSGVYQNNTWMSGSTVTVGDGATLTLANDLAIKGGTMIVNDATLNCADDVFVDGGTLILNVGSVTTSTDDWEANDGAGRITVNGGTHNSGTGTGNNVGAQGSASKIGCGIDFRGGTVTAGNFRFQINSISSVGGSAILASAGSGTTFSDMSGLVNITSDWTGSWEVGSFGAGDWESALTGGGNFTFVGATITAAIFTDYFIVTDNTTLSLNPNPPGNNRPVFTENPFSASDGTFGTVYTDSIAGSATDPDLDTLTYTNMSGGWLNIAPNGALSGTPDTLGTNEFTVVVTDGNFGSDTATLKIFIPTIGSPPEFTLNPFSASDGVFGAAYMDTIAGSATDPDFDILNYTKTGGPAWLTIAPNGALSGTPDTVGTNEFTVVVDDGNGNTDTGTLQIFVPSPGTETDFLGGDLKTAANWTIGLPGDAVTNGTIYASGNDGTGGNQQHPWLSGSTTIIGNNATLTMALDWSSSGAILVTINDATINCGDDFFVENSSVILNEGSVTTANDDWEANNLGGRITVNGGTHSSGTGTGNNVGAQGSASKRGCGVDFLGGTVTAGNFRFQVNSTSSVGGSAILASASSSTTFSDMAGLVDFDSDWNGSWEVGSFAPGDWKAALTNGNFTLDGAAIDETTAAFFFVSADGTTLTLSAPPEEVGAISIATLPDGSVEISWTGIAGHSYAVEYKNNLVIDQSWKVYTNGISEVGTITVTVDISEPETFYRVTAERN